LLVGVSVDLAIDGYFRFSALRDERSRIVRCVNGEAD
jgi:hypothetical protein